MCAPIPLVAWRVRDRARIGAPRVHVVSSVFATWCPDCAPVRAARAWVLEDAFLVNVLYALLPFAITALVIVLVARGVDREAPP